MVPSKVYLSKGEKRQLVFWTDQDYSKVVLTSQAPVTETTTSTSEQPEIDSFLQAVNGQLPGFGSIKGSQNETEEIDATVIDAEISSAGSSNDGINALEGEEDDRTTVSQFTEGETSSFEPVTAANVAEVESGVWIDVSHGNESNIVDNWST